MSDEFPEWLAAEIRRGDEQEAAIRSAYENTPRATMRAMLLVEIKCRRDEVLLHVWRSPEGLRYYQPRYKNSPAMNAATSTAAGREANTTDGERRWRSRGGALLPDGSIELNCDHVRTLVRMEDVAAMATEAAPGRPTRGRY